MPASPLAKQPVEAVFALLLVLLSVLGLAGRSAAATPAQAAWRSFSMETIGVDCCSSPC